MSKRLSLFGTAPEWASPSIESLTLRIRLITPMFGGGIVPGVVDYANPIRSASIRGHLRFWWRATAGSQCPTSKSLHAAEAALWGSAKEPGTVAIRAGLEPMSQAKLLRDARPGAVNLDDDSCLRQCVVYETSFPTALHNFPLYALQPFVDLDSHNRENHKKIPAIGLINVEFDLHLMFPQANRDEILTAVRAWVDYGGLGARTRRGCGSLKFVTTEQTDDLPGLGLSLHSPPVSLPDDLTILSGSTQLIDGNQPGNPVDLWKDAVKLYSAFRQQRDPAGDPAARHPGRSKWPEPDTIRSLIPRPWKHPIKRPLVSGFPRADLGLPITFKFKDDTGLQPDPPQTTLMTSGEGATRFASPVITKAMAVGDRFCSLILVLNSPHVWLYKNVVLREGAGANGSPITYPTASQIETTDPVMPAAAPLYGKSAREALMDFVAAQGWGRKTL